jgi:amino acid adenylation domain-containing protein
MNDPNTRALPPEQEAIQAKCLHSSQQVGDSEKAKIEQSITERFERIARQYPNRLAVKMGDRSLTYEDLNKAANRIAHAIFERHGQGSEPVALLFEHGIDVIAAIIAVIKTGKFYVALDPSAPRERVDYILKDSGARLIVTNVNNLDTAAGLSGGICVLLNVEDIGESFPVSNIGNLPSSTDLAVITYTSGSTGKPKGAAHTHQNWLSKLTVYTAHKRISPDDRVSLLHSLSFSASHGDLLVSLLNGASLLPFDIKAAGIHRLAKWLEAERITVCHIPVMAFRELAKTLSPEAKLSGLRLMYLSGAPITEHDFDLYKKTCPEHTQLEIGMGSTETGGICLAIIDHRFSFPKEGTPLGYPLPGKTVLLLDEKGQEVGFNDVGEIAVSSRYLSSGYWRNPELSASKFIADPSTDNARLYLTGDLGKRRSDGFLIHMGRKDLMVKIRGYRVDISEIEHTLREYSQVKAVGVVAWDRVLGEKYLVAYVVPRQNSVVTVDQVRSFLKEKLPDYMIPSAFMFLDSLPLTNGKLDRKALPEPKPQRPDISQPYLPPRTMIERELARVWAEILFLDRVGIHDDFFELGGHSLAATRVVSQVIKHFQIEIPLQFLFQAPTIAEMAAVIMEHQAKKLGEKDLERILAELESMSEEEAQKAMPMEVPFTK